MPLVQTPKLHLPDYPVRSLLTSPFNHFTGPFMKNGLNLPSDAEIDARAAAAGFTVGAQVHVRNAPEYTAAPIREFTWSDGQVVAVWMFGACRTPLQDLVLLHIEPQVLTEMDTILNSWSKDLNRAEREAGGEPTSVGNWIPDYPEQALVGEEEALVDKEADNQDSTEYSEHPADEQRD
jgi:hypothetical protein